MMVEGVERKLVAIVSADVAGYSRLISLDEVATVRTLTSYRETMSELVVQHRGRVVDNPGDNALIEFPSATDAVECAIEIQEAITERNQDVPADRKMEFRIGVHLGEVMVEGDRIYGEGVNVAARLEAMAPVGGICVSKTIRETMPFSSSPQLPTPWNASSRSRRRSPNETRMYQLTERWSSV